MLRTSLTNLYAAFTRFVGLSFVSFYFYFTRPLPIVAKVC